jgi:hypothetical protein
MKQQNDQNLLVMQTNPLFNKTITSGLNANEQ